MPTSESYPLSVIVEKIPNLGIRQRRTVDGNIIVRCLLQDRIRIVECVSQFTSKRRRRPNLLSAKKSSKKSYRYSSNQT